MEKLQLILSDFQGPLDLLLHLIKQAKIDIYDIPIADITQQYIKYLHQMNFLQLDIAGDYLVMASTLMRIKSQMLLPKSPLLEAENSVEEPPDDPRSDLVAQLLTYQTFKSISQTFKTLENHRQMLRAKSLSTLPNLSVIPLKPGVKTANDLAVTMADLLQRAHTHLEKSATVEEEQISIAQAQIDIIDQLQERTKATFSELLHPSATIEEVVTKFIALLELIKEQSINVQQLNYQADIIVTLR
ncbi:hypothetical protein DS831_07010 [Bombilactobacillus bombi]|uniref:Segregation and condensation protein A n=1 Tax=Bombilactobacillus bombi TaxID=1303590 RepID=A0A417ZFE2_9LACO|nr:segregation/condensation protein A [Bombilactobacillus bombi]RHW49906.1 hypothetical protein DS831_07010 [Bombilactobacillus bombi]